MITYVIEEQKVDSVPASIVRHGRGLRSLYRDLSPFCLTYEVVAIRSYGKHLCLTIHPLPKTDAPEEKSTQQDLSSR